MANPPSFVPRDFLEVPEFFGVHEDVTWHLAKDYAGAARLARSREQHELAYRIWLLRTEHKNSVQDVADVLGQRRENLWSKLNGKTPATEEDLIRWAWLVGEARRTYRPQALWQKPFGLPKFPLYCNKVNP